MTAVVLCGGAARRFGSDKTRTLLDGRPLLDHVLDGLPDDWPVLCVGEPRPTTRLVEWCREDPPGGGPVAAVAAALPHVRNEIVVVLGGDMPYAAEPATALAARLTAELSAETGAEPGDEPGAGAVLGRDGDGRVQPLLAAYRTDALRATLPDPAAGTPLMRLLDRLRTLVVPLPDGAALDVDTAADLERARHRLDP